MGRLERRGQRVRACGAGSTSPKTRTHRAARDWLRAGGVELDILAPAETPLPTDLDAYAGLVVLGATMSANDDQRIPLAADDEREVRALLGATDVRPTQVSQNRTPRRPRKHADLDVRPRMPQCRRVRIRVRGHASAVSAPVCVMGTPLPGADPARRATVPAAEDSAGASVQLGLGHRLRLPGAPCPAHGPENPERAALCGASCGLQVWARPTRARIVSAGGDGPPSTHDGVPPTRRASPIPGWRWAPTPCGWPRRVRRAHAPRIRGRDGARTVDSSRAGRPARW